MVGEPHGTGQLHAKSIYQTTLGAATHMLLQSIASFARKPRTQTNHSFPLPLDDGHAFKHAEGNVNPLCLMAALGANRECTQKISQNPIIFGTMCNLKRSRQKQKYAQEESATPQEYGNKPGRANYHKNRRATDAGVQGGLGRTT